MKPISFEAIKPPDDIVKEFTFLSRNVNYNQGKEFLKKFEYFVNCYMILRIYTVYKREYGNTSVTDAVAKRTASSS